MNEPLSQEATRILDYVRTYPDAKVEWQWQDAAYRIKASQTTEWLPVDIAALFEVVCRYALTHSEPVSEPPAPDTRNVPRTYLETLERGLTSLGAGYIGPNRTGGVGNFRWHVTIEASSEDACRTACNHLAHARDAVAERYAEKETTEPFVAAVEYLRTMLMNGEGNETIQEIVDNYDAGRIQGGAGEGGEA